MKTVTCKTLKGVWILDTDFQPPAILYHSLGDGQSKMILGVWGLSGLCNVPRSLALPDSGYRAVPLHLARHTPNDFRRVGPYVPARRQFVLQEVRGSSWFFASSDLVVCESLLHNSSALFLDRNVYLLVGLNDR